MAELRPSMRSRADIIKPCPQNHGLSGEMETLNLNLGCMKLLSALNDLLVKVTGVVSDGLHEQGQVPLNWI
jgi:hypothetical protein